LDRLIKAVALWSKDRGLDTADSKAQFIKVVEETGEIASALARNDEDELIDGIGDVIVTLIILAQQNDLSVEQCLKVAYDEIKDRKGEMKNGTFIKEEDL